MIGRNIKPGMVPGGFSKPMAAAKTTAKLPQRKKSSLYQDAKKFNAAAAAFLERRRP